MAAAAVQATFTGTQVHAGRDANFQIYNGHRHTTSVTDVLSTLRRHAALGALHNAAERPDPPKCHPETRTAILDRIDKWAHNDSHDVIPIMWLHGAAGAGKSAIAQTLIERWLKHAFICLNFFFWRTSDKRNVKTHLVSTLAFQLAELLPSTAPHLEKALRDGSVFDRNLETQIHQLIVVPLQAAQEELEGHTIVIVIDGLDECRTSLPKTKGFPGQDHEQQQREILQAVSLACQGVVFLRVLVASRPEPEIRAFFNGRVLRMLADEVSLNDQSSIKRDISLYLTCKFGEIKSQYPGIDSQSQWPSDEQMSQLIERSSEQFIYPSVVVKYISRRRRFPVESLKEVLALEPRKSTGDYPLAELDALYTLVLRTVHADSVHVVKMVFGLMCHGTGKHISGDLSGLPDLFQDIKPGFNALYLSNLLGFSKGVLLTHLTDLHSILSVSPSETDDLANMRFFHATFSEYLIDRSRSEEFFVDAKLQYLLALIRGIHPNATQPIIGRGDVGQPPLEEFDPAKEAAENYRRLATGLSQCQPSIYIMEGLLALLKDAIGDISQGASTTNLVSPEKQSGKLWDWFATSIPHSQFDMLNEQGYVNEISDIIYKTLQYLKECNDKPEIEALDSRRQAIASHISKLMANVLPNGSPQQDPQDQTHNGPSIRKSSFTLWRLFSILLFATFVFLNPYFLDLLTVHQLSLTTYLTKSRFK